MTDRTCQKCGEGLVVNEELGFMQCVSGKHVEAIDLVTAQWWNQCPKCKCPGLNTVAYERITQKVQKIKKADGSGYENAPVWKDPVKKTGIVFEEKVPKAIKCKACGNVFSK